jgi:UDP-glucose 4-epimerase
LALVERGEEVVVLDNLSTGMWWAVPPEAKLVEGDIGDEALLDRVMSQYSFDAVVHFAGSIVVPDSVRDPLGYYLNNTVKSRMLMACAVKAGIPRFIFSSTAAVYGNVPAEPVFEDRPPAPVSPYGTSKLMTEQMLKDSAIAYGLQYIALRYFNVAGADPKGRIGQSTPHATHLIKVAGQAALGQRERLEVFGTDYDTPDGTCLRDYIHVSDLADAHVLGLRKLLSEGGSHVFNLGNGTGYSVQQVIDTAKDVTGRGLLAHVGPRRTGDPPVLVASAGLARRELGWQPRYPELSTIISHAWRWHQELHAALS